jgi:hypothetical protein
LQDDEVLGEHIGLNLRVMFISAGGTVQKLLLLVDDRQAFFADRVPAIEISWSLLFGVIELVAHWAFHHDKVIIL